MARAVSEPMYAAEPSLRKYSESSAEEMRVIALRNGSVIDPQEW